MSQRAAIPTLLSEAAQGQIPGRQIADAWRFLKAALGDWLRVQDRRSLLLQQAGSLAEDESLPLLRQKIYAERQRAESGEAAAVDEPARHR